MKALKSNSLSGILLLMVEKVERVDNGIKRPENYVKKKKKGF